MSSENTTVTAQCLCKANTFTTTYPSTSLPLPGSICHCTSCRRVSGGLHTASTQWTTPLSGIDTSKLKAFAFSERTDLLFCPTCSTPLFWAWSQEPSEKLEVLTGVLSNNNTNLVKFTRQIFVHDTKDGGASVWLQYPNVDGSEAKRYALYEDVEVPRQWPDTSKLTGHDAKKEDTIPIHCKCKGVSLVLHRGDYSNVKPEDLPSRVDPTTHKYLAEVCACDSCRIQAGLDVFPWTFVDFKHIAFANSDKPFPKDKFELRDLVDAGDAAVGTLKYYHSSPPVHRFFCGTCSSTVFFTTDRRPTITDVAVGLLDASDGARAEGMLSWNLGGPLGYKEDGDGGWRQALYERVAKCAEEDRIVRGYPKNWERVKNDEEAAKAG